MPFVATSQSDRAFAARQAGQIIFCLIVLSLPVAGQFPAPILPERVEPATPPEVIPIPAVEQQALFNFINSHGGSLLLSEGLLRRLVDREQCDEGPVRDCILGADVYGTQTTQSKSEFDFFPSPAQLRWYVHLRGTTNSSTTGYTPQAVVQGQGEYRFQLTKQMDFQGNAIATRSPSAFLETKQRNIAAHTPADPIPLIGPLVSMAAFMGAEQRRPQAERIAAHRLTQELAPKFNDAIDTELVRLNQGLALARKKWPAQLGPVPTLESMSTDHFGLLALPGKGLAVTSPDWADLSTEQGFVIVVHQDQLTELVAKLPLAGQEIRDTQLDQTIQELSQLVGQVQAPDGTPNLPGLDGPTASLATLILDSERPLSFEFTDREAIIELRASLRPTLGGEIPTQRIRFGISSTLRETDALLTIRLVEISSLQPQANNTAQALARQILQQQIESRLHPISLPRSVTLPESVRTPALQKLRTASLASHAGWLIWKVE